MVVVVVTIPIFIPMVIVPAIIVVEFQDNIDMPRSDLGFSDRLRRVHVPTVPLQQILPPGFPESLVLFKP
jgi:hypothetical protein